MTNVFGRVDEPTTVIVDALDSCLKIIYEQRYLAQKNKAGEKNDILCDE